MSHRSKNATHSGNSLQRGMHGGIAEHFANPDVKINFYCRRIEKLFEINRPLCQENVQSFYKNSSLLFYDNTF